MVTIFSEKAAHGIKLPIALNEITPDVLKSIVDGIKVPKHYCIIAMAFKTKVFDFLSTITTKKDYSVQVTNFLAYIGDEDKEIVNGEVGDKIVIDRTSIERGNQLTVNISATVDNTKRFFDNDKELVKTIITGNHECLKTTDSIILLNFKIVPACDIKACIAPTRIQPDVFYVSAVNMN